MELFGASIKYVDGGWWWLTADHRGDTLNDGFVLTEAEAKEAVIADAQSHYDMMVGGLTEDLERIKREFAPEENDI